MAQDEGFAAVQREKEVQNGRAAAEQLQAAMVRALSSHSEQLSGEASMRVIGIGHL